MNPKRKKEIDLVKKPDVLIEKWKCLTVLKEFSDDE